MIQKKPKWNFVEMHLNYVFKNRNQFVDVFQRFALKLDVESITIAMSSYIGVFANLEGEGEFCLENATMI